MTTEDAIRTLVKTWIIAAIFHADEPLDSAWEDLTYLMIDLRQEGYNDGWTDGYTDSQSSKHTLTDDD